MWVNVHAYIDQGDGEIYIVRYMLQHSVQYGKTEKMVANKL